MDITGGGGGLLCQFLWPLLSRNLYDFRPAFFVVVAVLSPCAQLSSIIISPRPRIIERIVIVMAVTTSAAAALFLRDFLRPCAKGGIRKSFLHLDLTLSKKRKNGQKAALKVEHVHLLTFTGTKSSRSKILLRLQDNPRFTRIIRRQRYGLQPPPPRKPEAIIAQLENAKV